MANQQPLIINNWQNGIADSPNVGFGLLQNVSIDALPGAVVPNYIPSTKSPTASSNIFTAVAATDVCTVALPFAANQTAVAVTFSTTGSLPSPLATGTVYFLINLSSNTFKVATTLAHALTGTAIDITDTGSGVHTVANVQPGFIRSMCDDPSINTAGITYMADSNGRVWFYDGTGFYLLLGNTLTNGTGRGVAFFINSDASARFLFIFRNNFIDVCDVTTAAKRNDPIGTSSWTNGWQTINTTSSASNSHYAIVGQDDIIYYCDSRYVGSIQEVPGQVFDPGTSATYNWSKVALTLPQGEVANWLEELQINLLVAGLTYNYIYPWDRSSASFALPIICAETGVYRIKNINNIIYILNGTRGNIYKTMGYYVQFVKKIPEYLTGNSSLPVISWGGIGAKNGNLIFGVSCSDLPQYSGLYMLYSDGRLVLENQPGGGGLNLPVTAVNQTSNEAYRFGYAGGFDVIPNNPSRYANFNAVVHSQLSPVGTKTTPVKYSQVEVQINQPSNGSEIRVSYRTDRSSPFTVLDTYTGDTTTTSFNTDIGLIDIENIQIQVEMSGASSDTSALEIMQVRLFQ